MEPLLTNNEGIFTTDPIYTYINMNISSPVVHEYFQDFFHTCNFSFLWHLLFIYLFFSLFFLMSLTKVKLSIDTFEICPPDGHYCGQNLKIFLVDFVGNASKVACIQMCLLQNKNIPSLSSFLLQISGKFWKTYVVIEILDASRMSLISTSELVSVDQRILCLVFEIRVQI